MNNYQEKIHSIIFPFKKEGSGFSTGEHTVSQEVYPQPQQQLVRVSLEEEDRLEPVLAECETQQPPTSIPFLIRRVMEVSWVQAVLESQIFTGIQDRVIVREGEK